MVIRIVLWLIAIVVALVFYGAAQSKGVIAFFALGIVAEGLGWTALLKKRKAKSNS